MGALAGDNRFIVDFLVEEMLSRQPADIRQFLARTAVLGRFCAPLCEAVAGSSRAAEVIDALEREDLFPAPLDDNREWYRYHHLFVQVLRGQLTKTEPDIAPICKSARTWHRLSGTPDEAIRYALAAGNTAEAADLIARAGSPTRRRAGAGTVRAWLRSVGDDQIGAHPLAAHSAGWLACGRWNPPSHCSAAPLDSTAYGRYENRRPRPSSWNRIQDRPGYDRAQLQHVPFRRARSDGAAQQGHNERRVGRGGG